MPDKILATKKKKGSEVLFCWADCFVIYILGGLLKIKMLIYSCHHLLKRPELKERKKSLDYRCNSI